MILADYPGDVAAVALLVAAAVLLVAAFRSQVAKAAGRWRWLLGLLRYAAIAALLIIIWNPSRPTGSESSARNTVLAIFDTSESMSVGDGTQSSRLDRAVEAFKTHLEPGDPEGPVYRLYGFDSQAYPADSADALKRWGPRTNAHAVLDLLNRYDLGADTSGRPGAMGARGSKVVGAVVFTDGQADNKNVQSYLPPRNPDLKVLLVGVGSAEVPKDLAIKSIRAPATVALGTPYQVEVELTAKGIENQRATVVLLEDGVPADFKSVRLGKNPARMTLRFDLGARVLGPHRLTARAAIDTEEPNTANNERHSVLEIVQAAKMRVLLYSEVANFDFGKIRACLERDEKIDLDIGLDAVIAPGLSEATRAGSGHVPLPQQAKGFYEYDVIILGPCNMDGFSQARIDGLYRFVTERGGGLVFLPGRGERDLSKHTDERIAALLPVELPTARRTAQKRRGELALTPEGVRSGFLTEETLEQLPVEAAAYHPGAAAKPAAAVLARAGDRPLVCWQRIGRGAVCMVNTYGLFKWYREDLEGGMLAEFLRGLTASLGRIRSAAARVELFAARRSENPYEVEFEAKVYDESFAGVEGATVLLEVGGETVRMEEAANGRYVALIKNLREENLVARVEAEKAAVFIGERVLATALPVPRREMDRTELDGAFLEKLAERLGGTYTDASGDGWKDKDLFEAVSVSYESGVESAWRNWPLIIALCVLLTTAWFVRRAIGLI